MMYDSQAASLSFFRFFFSGSSTPLALCFFFSFLSFLDLSSASYIKPMLASARLGGRALTSSDVASTVISEAARDARFAFFSSFFFRFSSLVAFLAALGSGSVPSILVQPHEISIDHQALGRYGIPPCRRPSASSTFWVTRPQNDPHPYWTGIP